MTRHLLARTAAALALIAAAPAAAQLSSDMGLKLTLTSGEWRSSTGYEGSIRVGGTSYGFNGASRKAGDASTEELTFGGARRDFTGHWRRYYGRALTEHGTILLTASLAVLSGHRIDQRGEARAYFLCKRPGTAGSSSAFDGTDMWVRAISAKRNGGGPEIDAVIEIQPIRQEGRLIDLSRATAYFTRADGRMVQAQTARDASGNELGMRSFGPCDHQELHYRWTDLPDAVVAIEFFIAGKRVGEMPVSVPAVTAGRPAPQPAPAPVPAPAPAPAPTPAPVPGGMGVPSGAAGFVRYGPWDFKVNELARGPDGHFQAVFTVRNASQQRLGFSITDFDVTLIDADGRGIRRLGNLYRASVTGPASSLANAGMSYLEPGDELRGRIVFPGTKGFAPAQLRIKEPVRSLTVNTYPLR